MSPRARIVFALTLTAVLLTVLVTTVISRARHWQARGMVGLSYIKVLPDGSAQPNIFPVKPGRVIITYPTSAAAKAGIRAGDEILSINGIDLKNDTALRAMNTRLQAGDIVTYRIRRSGKEIEQKIALKPPLPNPLMTISASIQSIVAAAFLTIGLLVFTRAPMDRRSTVFYAMVTAGALSLIANIMASIDVGAMRGIVPDAEPNFPAIILVGCLSLSFLPLTLHLSLVFPRDRPSLLRNPRLLGWVYGVPLVALLLGGTFLGLIAMLQGPRTDQHEWIVEVVLNWGSGIVGVAGLLIALRIARKARTEGTRDAFASRPLQSLVAIFALFITVTRIFAALKWKFATIGMTIFTVGVMPLTVAIAYPVLICVLLYRSYKDSGVEERRQVKWPLWGTLIAVGSKIIFSTATFALTFTILGSGRDLGDWMPVTMSLQIVPTLLYLLIPISFAVAILKYRLMNIDVIIKKTVVYAILSGAIIILYLVLVGGVGTVLVAATGLKNQTMVVLSTLVVAGIFVPLRNKLQHLVDRNLFRQKIDYPQALRAISADTLAASDLKWFLNASAEKLQQALQNRSVVIFQRRGDEMIATSKIGVADSILGSAAISAATAESFDRPLDPRRRPIQEKDAAALRSVGTTLALPVRSHTGVVAVIALASKLSDREFDLEDIEFASSAADQIGIGIDRIRTQHDEADFEQARTLQQGLMPTEAPKLPGVDVAGIWQPARTVGGDYYDFLKLNETQLGICIGDVAGKGMPAALLMSGLQAAVRASADPDVLPSRVVERVRRVVVPSLAGRFVSFFYCTFDTTTRRLRYCNAGHNPPVVIRADGTPERLTSGGAVLSRLFRDSPLLDGEVSLHSGDRLVLFTDGVSEARDATETDYGDERLEQFIADNRSLNARDLAAAIATAVATYAGGHPDDDLTLVTLAVNEQA